MNCKIISDEIGIEVGVSGPLRLKTAFRKVFRVSTMTLSVAAVSAETWFYRDGSRIDHASSERDRDQPLLHVGNLVNLDADDMPLVLRLAVGSMEEARERLAAMAAKLAANYVAPECVCIMLDARLELEVAGQLAALVRSKRMSVGLSDFGTPDTEAGAVQAINPTIVAINGQLVRRLANARGLMRTLTSQLTDAGADVLIEDVCDSDDLRQGLAAGATLLSGDFLAPPALAGSLFGARPLRLEALLSPGDNVVPLVRRDAR